jgi:hypothetical protein
MYTYDSKALSALPEVKSVMEKYSAEDQRVLTHFCARIPTVVALESKVNDVQKKLKSMRNPKAVAAMRNPKAVADLRKAMADGVKARKTAVAQCVVETNERYETYTEEAKKENSFRSRKQFGRRGGRGGRGRFGRRGGRPSRRGGNPRFNNRNSENESRVGRFEEQHNEDQYDN